MNGGILPLALLCTTLGLMLARVDRRTAFIGLGGLVASAVLVSLTPIALRLSSVLFTGAWLSMIATAALVYLPRSSLSRLAIPAAINVGGWTGALASLAGTPGALLLALPLALLFVPGQWIVERGYDIALKVVASWMIAIAALALFVSLMPTPGYKPDHMQ